MKTSKSDTENQTESKDSTLDDLLKKGKSDRKDNLPGEEFITPDPTRSAPDKNTEAEEVDSMGISEKAKNQASDERDVAKDR
ncbi:hypothetical protein M3O96_20825 [Aquiflexum sp. TKW24L]|uniref:hypothetical protein n=1 Tax=Aquiflexum sp. TKW24L TaxID=2942212 RepID=UPI0020BF2BF7|nr:hypothetical protein [Aquiflexum sp. TKW24L]MCL6261557.1 hypothetical protein [Aquiflexum sp. TKW24L]